MLRCALTGVIPKHPVLSPQGIVFEKEAIQQYLVNSSVCPVTGNPLTFDTLIDIQVNQPTNYPAAVRATSFTDYLNGLTEEWNLAQKELYETRKQLAQCQRELAQALYETMVADLPTLYDTVETFQPDEAAVTEQAQQQSSMLSFMTTDLEGNAIDSSVFASYDLTVVNFFASYSYPDINELAELESFSQSLKKDYPNVNFLQVIICADMY